MPATILVADDDRAIRMVLNQALIRLGHDVRMTGMPRPCGDGSPMARAIWSSPM